MREKEKETQKTQKLAVKFYQSNLGKEPVREWLKSLTEEEKKIIGKDIMKVQFGWPLGIPLVKKLESELWEVRTNLEGKIARVLFTLDKNIIVLLHGFIKKTQKTPLQELETARSRLKRYQEENHEKK